MQIVLKKKMPNAIRFYKNKDKDSHEGMYSQILLYHAFQDEMKDLREVREDPDRCREMFIYPATTEDVAENEDAIRQSDIIKVRAKVMPYLVDVQEAREQAIATLNQKMAEGLDAENAQDNDDCNQLPPEIHPDFETQHPDCFLEGSKQHMLLTNKYDTLDFLNLLEKDIANFQLRL